MSRPAPENIIPKEESALSDILPTLESAGFRVIEDTRSKRIAGQAASRYGIRDFKLPGLRPACRYRLEPLSHSWNEVLLKVWRFRQRTIISTCCS